MTVIGAIIGLAFALPLTVDEDNVFGNVLDLAAEMVFIIAAQRVLFSDKQKTANAEESTVNIQKQLDELTEKVNNRYAKLKMKSRSGILLT
jgi:hypothetical protein